MNLVDLLLCLFIILLRNRPELKSLSDLRVSIYYNLFGGNDPVCRTCLFVFVSCEYIQSEQVNSFVKYLDFKDVWDGTTTSNCVSIYFYCHVFTTDIQFTEKSVDFPDLMTGTDLRHSHCCTYTHYVYAVGRSGLST